MEFGKHPVQEILSAENLAEAGIGEVDSFMNEILSESLLGKKKKTPVAEPSQGQNQPSHVPDEVHRTKSSSGQVRPSSRGSRGEGSHSHSRSGKSRKRRRHATSSRELPPRQNDPEADLSEPEADKGDAATDSVPLTHYDTVARNFHKTISLSFDKYYDASMQDSVVDMQEGLSKVFGSCCRIVGEIAKRSKVVVSDLDETLQAGRDNMQSKEDQVARLMKENAQLRKQNEIEFDKLRVSVREKDQLLVEVQENMKIGEEERVRLQKQYDTTMKSLEQKLSVLETNRQKAEDKLKTELTGAQAKYAALQDRCRDSVKIVQKKSYKECTEIMLKKIRNSYPNADLKYFADLTDYPSDVEVDPALLQTTILGESLPPPVAAPQEQIGDSGAPADPK